MARNALSHTQRPPHLCKLFRVQSPVLSLISQMEYVKEVFERSGEQAEDEGNRKVRIMVVDAR